MISIHGLTKQYGGVRAVDELSFEAAGGQVTGFLGPNGAGKSTTMRIAMGLDRADAGTATINGRSYAALSEPLRQVGALLDAGAMHPGRTGRAHLRIAARSNGIRLDRVEQVVDQVGLGKAAGRRIKGYSLGMRQRLGIAAALLGDPEVLLFDEPVNGLDLDGVRWIRGLLRGFADEGRTVLVSSHLMSEVQLVADHVVIIGRGRLIADAPIDDVLRGFDGQRVRVRTPRSEDLMAALTSLTSHASAEAARVSQTGPEELEVTGMTSAEVGDVAFASGIRLHHLAEIEDSLEQAYLTLTESSVEHHGSVPASAPARASSAADGAVR